jgi:hypothetical protein
MALAFYAIFGFILLHAILFHISTHGAGYDYFNYNWNFWWIRHALHTPGLDIYENNFVMFPAVTNYGYHVLAMGWFPLWAALEPIFGTLTAVNLIILLSCILNGWMTFIWLRSEGVGVGLALIGGAALQAFPITRYFYYNTHLNLMIWFWLIGLLLLWKRIAHHVEAHQTRSALIWAAIFGAALWGLVVMDLQMPIFAAFLLIPYGLRTAWRLRQRETFLRLAGAAALSQVVALSLLWFASPLRYILRFEGTLAPGSVEERPGIPLSGLISMASEWWSWSQPSVGAFFTTAVLLALAVSLFSRVRVRNGRWFWFAVMLPPLLLALGPTLHIGDAAIPLPFYRWLHALTDGMFRMPWRFAPLAVIAGMAFVGLTLTAWGASRRVNARIWGGAAALLALGASVRIFESAPLTHFPYPYAFYDAIGAERGEPYDRYVVIEVPTAAGTGEVLFGDPRAIQLQWYGIAHGKRMLNGFISRAPIENIWYIVADDPMMAWLGQRRMLEPEAVERQMRERIFSYPIGYFVVHLDLIGAESETAVELIGYLNSLPDLVCPIWIEGDAVVYRTAAHPDGCPPRIPTETPEGYQIDIGAPDDWRYLGWGWHWREPVGGIDWRWTGAPPAFGAEGAAQHGSARLYLELPRGEYTVTLNAQAFGSVRTVRVSADGVELTPISAPSAQPDGLGALAFALTTDGGFLELEIDGGAADDAGTRALALAVESIRFARVGS